MKASMQDARYAEVQALVQFCADRKVRIECAEELGKVILVKQEKARVS
jgi:hypothetical protein